MNKILLAFGLSLVLILGIGYVTLSWSYQNKEIRLSNSIKSKIDGNKSHMSKMKSIIFGNAEVAKKYSKDFATIYPDLISGRYSKHQGKLMQWVQESNPNYSTKLLENVQKNIESQRESFHYAQLQLINLGLEHDNLIKEIPFGRWFLSDKEHIDIPVIKNGGIDEEFETGIETKQSLF